jgi:hypothetical protein
LTFPTCFPVIGTANDSLQVQSNPVLFWFYLLCLPLHLVFL